MDQNPALKIHLHVTQLRIYCIMITDSALIYPPLYSKWKFLEEKIRKIGSIPDRKISLFFGHAKKKLDILEHFRSFLEHFWSKKWSRSQFCLIAGDVDHIMLIKDQIMLLGCVFIIFGHFKYRTPLNSLFLSKIYTFPRISLQHLFDHVQHPIIMESGRWTAR